MELPIDVIERTQRGVIADRGPHRLSPDHPPQTQIAHQARNSTTGDSETLTVHLPPNLPHAVHAEILGKDAHNLGLEILIASGTIRQALRVMPLCDTLVVGGWGNWQNPANRLAPYSARCSSMKAVIV